MTLIEIATVFDLPPKADRRNNKENMKKTYKINGMHCVSCEINIQDQLKNIPGIEDTKVSHKTGVLEINTSDKYNEYLLKEAVAKLGFSIGDKSENKNKQTSLFKNIAQTVLIFLGVWLVFFVITSFEIANLVPSSENNTSLLAALLIGIVASLSTCLALTGGIIMGFSAKTKIEEGKSVIFTRAKPQILFHIGRLGGFFLLGGLLGLFGELINFSLSAMAILVFAVSLVMFYLGLNIMGLVPNITSLGFHLPKGLALKIKKYETAEHALAPVLIGALTFFLPCGFTQSMQLAAIASGSFLGGAMTMTFFALGTLPVLFAVGFGSSYAQIEKFSILKKVIGSVIIFFALYSFNNALVLSGSAYTLTMFTATESEAKQEALINQDEQVIRMDIDYTFKQREFKIVKDIPVRWEINAINLTGCSNEVIIPRLGLTTGKLKDGINILEFTPTQSGILPFSCWMGMISGRFIVVDSPDDLSKATSNPIQAVSASESPKEKTCGGSCGGSTCGAKTGGTCGCGN